MDNRDKPIPFAENDSKNPPAKSFLLSVELLRSLKNANDACE